MKAQAVFCVVLLCFVLCCNAAPVVKSPLKVGSSVSNVVISAKQLDFEALQLAAKAKDYELYIAETKLLEKENNEKRQSGCPNACSSHGTCNSNGTCSCYSYYAGADCSVPVYELNANKSILTNQIVASRTWNYYFVKVAAYQGAVWTLSSSTGDCDLYLRFGDLPTLEVYDQRNISFLANETLTFNALTNAGNWYLGVWGYYKCYYSISIQIQSDCSLIFCSGNGKCINNLPVCACNAGWGGKDCSQRLTQLVPNVRINTAIAANKIDYYYYNVNQSLELLSIFVNETGDSNSCQAGFLAGYGFYPDYSNFNYSSDYAYQTYQIDIPYPLKGIWYFGLFDFSYLQNGSCKYTILLSVTSTQNSVCLSNCSAHGICSGVTANSSVCNCQSGFSGSYCETMENSLVDYQIVTGSLSDGLWNYFHYLSRSVDPLLVTLNETSDSKDCDLYIKRDTLPSLSNFDYIDVGLAQNKTLIIQDPQFSTWYIGLFGFQKCKYLLSVAATTSCSSQCVAPYGFCTSTGDCACYDGYAGDNCQVRVIPASGNGSVLTGQLYAEQWAYYQVNVSTSFLAVHLLETKTIGNLWLFVSLDFFPTLAENDYDDKETNTAYHALEIPVYVPDGFGAVTYYVGVYGTPFDHADAAYQLAIWESPI